MTSDQYYRVAIKYRWYWNGVVEQSGYFWAGTHEMFFSMRNGDLSSWLTGAIGDYCHMDVDRWS